MSDPDNRPDPLVEFYGEPIHVYTRDQALADGALRDVSATAAGLGFRLPVAITASVYADYVAWPEGDGGQSENARLWDVLTLTRYAAVRDQQAATVRVLLHVVPPGGEVAQPVTLYASITGESQAGVSPVLTIMTAHDF